MIGAVAKAVPVTTTKAICIENARSPHTPSPHAIAIWSGLAPAAGIAAINTMIVRITAKMNASGSHLLMTFTHPAVNFLIITSYYEY